MIPTGINLEKMEVVYSQESDSCEEGESGQELIITSDDAGGGPFLRFKTERWSLDWDETDNFIQILNDFKSRFKGE